MRDKEAQLIWEALHGEDCGVVHASTKRKKKKIKEADTQKCDHCDGKGWHEQEEYPFAKKKCDRCSGDGELDDTGDRDDPGVVKEAGGDYMALRQEVDEYLTTAVHTTGAEDLKANVLEIIDRHLGGAGAAPAPVPAPAPTGPISSPARQSQSPLRPSGMSGPGMMP